MKVVIVGGDFKQVPKPSSVIRKFAECFDDPTVYNGGTPEDLLTIDLSGHDLIIWAPNVDNEVEKHYPKKDKGAILICSKVLHDDRTIIDAISRIFLMHGNAVIAITAIPGQGFAFKLVDALGNVWYSGQEIRRLIACIIEIYDWTKNSIRMKTTKSDFVFNGTPPDMNKLIELNKIVADKFEAMGGRFFGNVSTRCKKMFPSARVDEEFILVSRRNVDKRRIEINDFVMVRYTGEVEYLGENKPSVDTPIQAKLYAHTNINYMIHGHSYIKGYPFTDHYYPCGDMREFYGVMEQLTAQTGCINLRNHGFLLFASTIEGLEDLVNGITFIEREVGYEEVHSI